VISKRPRLRDLGYQWESGVVLICWKHERKSLQSRGLFLSHDPRALAMLVISESFSPAQGFYFYQPIGFKDGISDCPRAPVLPSMMKSIELYTNSNSMLKPNNHQQVKGSASHRYSVQNSSTLVVFPLWDPPLTKLTVSVASAAAPPLAYSATTDDAPTTNKQIVRFGLHCL